MKKITLYRFLLISLAAVMGIGGTVRAETPPIKAELLTPVQQRMQQEVSVDFRETPIEDVLRILAKQADVDIIKSPKVIGTVTATLTDVPLSEALENILASQGYSFVTTTNMIRVIPKEELTEAREKQVSRVYRVTYADVKEVEAALKKFISQEGSISSNPGTSNIIVTDSESKINAINSFMILLPKTISTSAFSGMPAPQPVMAPSQPALPSAAVTLLSETSSMAIPPPGSVLSPILIPPALFPEQPIMLPRRMR
jgi:type II secretory pathway component GspD/PulD (secretin)